MTVHKLTRPPRIKRWSEANKFYRKKFLELIEDFRSNNRVQQPTQYEQILRLFLGHNGEDVPVEALENLFEEREDDARSYALTKLAKLNNKLQPFQLRIVKVNAAYRVISLVRLN
jgi:hypothetical protein